MRYVGIVGVVAVLALADAAAADRVTGGTEALNGFRAKVDRPPLVHSGQLQQAAERHLREMDRRGVLTHGSADGGTLGDRVKATGYRYCFAAENIARGQRSLQEVVGDWALSEGHRANMLSPRAREFGFARGGDRYWVLVVAAPGC